MNRHRGLFVTLAIVMALTVMALVLAGCGSNKATDSSTTASSAVATTSAPTTAPAVDSTTSPSATTPTTAPAAELSGTLRFFSHSPLQAGMTEVIANFEKLHPKVKVEAQYVSPGPDYSQTLITQIQAGNAPDVFYTDGGSGNPVSLIPLAKAGKLADLTGASYEAAVSEQAKDLFYNDGKLVGMPLGVAGEAVIYNADEFAKLGIEAPATWADFLALCEKIKAAGKVPIVFPGQAPAHIPLTLSANDVYAADPAWDSKRASGQVTFVGEAGWQKVLQQIDELNKKGYYQEGAAGTGIPQAFQMVASGQALMFIGPFDALGPIIGMSEGKVKFAAFPIPGETADSTVAMIVYGQTLCISADSKNLEAAKAFLEFVSQPDQGAVLTATGGTISMPDAVKGNFPPYLSTFAPLYKAGKVVAYPAALWPSEEVLNAFNTAATSIVTGQKSIEEALKGVDEAWDASK
jgi:raffinose/stachyose/melibiose transport system substrate-binding protein